MDLGMVSEYDEHSGEYTGSEYDEHSGEYILDRHDATAFIISAH